MPRPVSLTAIRTMPLPCAVVAVSVPFLFFFSSRRRHTRLQGDWSSDVCSSDLVADLVASAKKDGSARRGLAVFRAAKFACLSCHQAGKFGGAVGPALTDGGDWKSVV